MPILPSDEDSVDIRKSKHWNKNKHFTVKAIVDLSEYSLPERASIMTYALTADQQTQYDEYVTDVDKSIKIEGSFYNLLLKLEKRTTYLDNKQTLVLNGKLIDMSISPRAHGLLKALFSKEEYLKDKIAYLDILAENRQELRTWDVTSVDQIKSLKHFINKTARVEVFPLRGYLILNEEFAKNLILI